jgi:hypothetical protein
MESQEEASSWNEAMKRPVVATSRYIKIWMINGNVGRDLWFEKEAPGDNN